MLSSTILLIWLQIPMYHKKSLSHALHNSLLYFKFQRECLTSSQVSHAEEVILKRFPLWESENASQSPSLWRHLPLSPKPYEVSSHKYSDAECKYVSQRRRRENTWTLLKIELVDDPFRWDVKLGRTFQACATKKGEQTNEILGNNWGSRCLVSFQDYFYPTQVRSLTTLATHWLSDSLLLSRLDWCDSGLWRSHLKTSWCG